MSDSILTPVLDVAGNERRLGLCLPDPTFVCMMPVFEAAMPQNLLTPDQVKQLLTDPSRTPSSDIFDDHWVKEGDQGHPGSCNGWAGASAMSKTRYLRGIQDGLVLSGSYVYSWINNGQDNGSPLDRGMAELAAHGAPAAARCDKNKIYRNQTQQFDAEAMNHLGLNCYAITTRQGLDSAVALRFMVVVALHVGNAFMNYKGKGLIPVVAGIGNHAIHVDDGRLVGQDVQYKPVNNWNLTWGERGYGWTTFDSFKQTMKRVENGRQVGVHQFYAITSTQEAGN